MMIATNFFERIYCQKLAKFDIFRIFLQENLEVTEKHRIFAPTVPTTLPTCTADQGGAFAFYIDMKYTKLPLDYPEIISLLKERGLIIEGDNKAKNYLKVISYFRLANYFHPM